MKKSSLTILGVVSIVIAFVFVFAFPLVNEAIVGDQVETHTATVLTCDQKYRKSFLVKKSGETRYTFTVTATLEDGKEITAVENNSYQQREYSRGEKITVYGLKGKYKLDRKDLFAPWVGNSEILYLVIIVIGAVPILIGSKMKR